MKYLVATLFVLTLGSKVNGNEKYLDRLSSIEEVVSVKEFDTGSYNPSWQFETLGFNGETYYTECIEKAKTIPGNVYRIQYRSAGLKVYGFLFLPEDFDEDKKYPTVIMNRGGNRDFRAFNLCMKERVYRNFLQHEMVVFLPDLRGAGGGKGQEEWGGAEITDILTLESIALKSRVVKSGKLYMYGHARGAMSTTLALSQGSKANKAVLVAGTYDQFSALRHRPDLEHTVAKPLIPRYKDNRYEELRRRSAVFWADQLPQIPILALHGTDDWRAPASQTKKMELAMKSFNPDFSAFYYTNEGHGLEGVRNLEAKHISEFLQYGTTPQELEKAILPGWIKKSSDLESVSVDEDNKGDIRNKILDIWDIANHESRYKDAAHMVSKELDKYPKSFRLQSFYALVLGDSSSEFPPEVRGQVHSITVSIMEKLLSQTEGQKQKRVDNLRNEYLWQTAQHLDQYHHGEAMVARKNRGGYYSMGVGAAWYAHQLMLFDRIDLAQIWARKSVAAWKEYYSSYTENGNSYTHLALAFGILGQVKPMDLALHRGAKIMGVTMEGTWIVEIRDHIDGHYDNGRITETINLDLKWFENLMAITK